MHHSAGSIMVDGTDDVGCKGWDSALFMRLSDSLHELGVRINNARDILLAEVAITNGLALLTANKGLADLVSSYGGEAILFFGS